MACWKQKVYLPVRSYISFSFRPSIRLALRTNVTYLPILYVQGAQSAFVVSAPESLQKKCPYIAKMIDGFVCWSSIHLLSIFFMMMVALRACAIAHLTSSGSEVEINLFGHRPRMDQTTAANQQIYTTSRKA